MPITKTTDEGSSILGLDVSKETIAVGILRADEVEPDAEKIVNDEVSVRRLIERLDDPQGPASLLRGRADRLRAAPPARLRSGCAPMWSLPRSSRGSPATGSRPTVATAGAWPACTGPVS